MLKDNAFTEELAQSSLAELRTWWRDALETFMGDIGVADRLSEAVTTVESDPLWKTLASDWITLPTAARETRFGQLLELLHRAGYATRQECLRCGTCCRTSSPSLFAEDLRLFNDGVLARADVYTIRRGEVVRLPENLGTMQLKEEVLKIREDGHQGACRFYEPDDNSCGIYHDRPLQCRAQACWDTSDLREVIGGAKRLSRANVVSPDEAVAEALVAHEAHTAVIGLQEAFEDARAGREDGMELVIDALVYDEQLRPLLRDKLPLPAEELEFYFGRPVRKVIHQFGVRVVEDENGGCRIEPLEPTEESADEVTQ